MQCFIHSSIVFYHAYYHRIENEFDRKKEQLSQCNDERESGCPPPSLRGLSTRIACTPIDNRIISREPARRLMSALMNNRLRMALCRRSINRSTNGYREFTPRNPDIRLCAIVIPSIHPRILDSFRGYLCWMRERSRTMQVDSNSIRFVFSPNLDSLLFSPFGILLDVRSQ